MAKDKNPQHTYPRDPVFYQNYDLYETEGVDGPAKQGPGAGFYQNMDKYKSVSDFVKKKRKRKSRQRKIALLSIACDINKIDFPSDESSNTIPFDSVMPIGMFDNLNPSPTEDDPKPIKFNPLGVADGNERAVDEEPEETKNNYYGVLG